MVEDGKVAQIQGRIEKAEATLASMARMADELVAIRKEVPAGEHRDRVDNEIRLNHETSAAVRRGMMISEEDLGRIRA